MRKRWAYFGTLKQAAYENLAGPISDEEGARIRTDLVDLETRLVANQAYVDELDAHATREASKIVAVGIGIGVAGGGTGALAAAAAPTVSAFVYSNAVRLSTGSQIFGEFITGVPLTVPVAAGSVPALVATADDMAAGTGRLIGAAERGAFSGAYATNGELVQSIAIRADRIGSLRRGLGNGPVAGTEKHDIADVMLTRYQRMFGDRGLSTERRYLGGQLWEEGMPVRGSIRLDVIEGPLTNPTKVWNYKFGNATLSQSRITQIRNGIPNGANVPVLEIKP